MTTSVQVSAHRALVGESEVALALPCLADVSHHAREKWQQSPTNTVAPKCERLTGELKKKKTLPVNVLETCSWYELVIHICDALRETSSILQHLRENCTIRKFVSLSWP